MAFTGLFQSALGGRGITIMRLTKSRYIGITWSPILPLAIVGRTLPLSKRTQPLISFLSLLLPGIYWQVQLPRINLRLADQQKGKANVFVQIYDPFSSYPFCPVRCISLTMEARFKNDSLGW